MANDYDLETWKAIANRDLAIIKSDVQQDRFKRLLPMKPNQLIRPFKVAEIFDVSTATIYRWCHEGRLEGIKIGESHQSTTLRITKKSVLSLMGLPEETEETVWKS